MKKLILVVTLQCFSIISMAQEAARDSIGYSVINNIKFKNGIDTIELTVLYNSDISGDQDPRLGVISGRKQVLDDGYENKNHESTYIAFMIPDCDRRFMGILNRKNYDRHFIRKNIGDYRTPIVDLNVIKTYQKVYIKAVVFEDQNLMDRRGGYLFAILDLKPI